MLWTIAGIHRQAVSLYLNCTHSYLPLMQDIAVLSLRSSMSIVEVGVSAYAWANCQCQKLYTSLLFETAWNGFADVVRMPMQMAELRPVVPGSSSSLLVWQRVFVISKWL